MVAADGDRLLRGRLLVLPAWPSCSLPTKVNAAKGLLPHHHGGGDMGMCCSTRAGLCSLAGTGQGRFPRPTRSISTAALAPQPAGTVAAAVGNMGYKHLMTLGPEEGGKLLTVPGKPAVVTG